MATVDVESSTKSFYLTSDALQLVSFGFTRRYLNVGVDDISSIIFFYVKSLFNKFYFINPNSSHISITRSQYEDSVFCKFHTKLSNSVHRQKTVLLQPFISEMFKDTISSQNNNNNSKQTAKAKKASIASKIKMKLRLLTPNCSFYNSEFNVQNYNRRYCYQAGIIGINKFDINGKKVDSNKQLEKLTDDIKKNSCIQSLKNFKDITVSKKFKRPSKLIQVQVTKDDIKKYYQTENVFDEFVASFIQEETIYNCHLLRLKHNKHNNHITWCNHDGPLNDDRSCVTLRHCNKDTFVNVTIERNINDNDDYKLYFEKQDINNTNGDGIQCEQLFGKRENSIVLLNFEKYEYLFVLSTVVCDCKENLQDLTSVNSFQFKVSIESE